MVFSSFVSLRAKRVLLGAAVLTLGLVAGPLTARTAGATFTTCDTDPIVLLSNGQVVSVGTHIGDSASDVTSIVYTLHGPAGTSVRGVAYTSTELASKESVQFYADNPAGTYDTHTVVRTASGTASISATTTVYSLWHAPSTGTVTGQDGQDLPVHLTL